VFLALTLRLGIGIGGGANRMLYVGCDVMCEIDVDVYFREALANDE
jgi:hypothetical protein